MNKTNKSSLVSKLQEEIHLRTCLKISKEKIQSKLKKNLRNKNFAE